mgnify:CR=1 FL=1|uniref:Redoxin domain-containing protein n=1 Tax=Schlesneria paludicola TaxID=360056 RepID=A0A7C4QRP1_9PLAN
MTPRRIAGLALIGLVLGALCAWRVGANRPQSYSAQLQAARIEIPAPLFSGVDAHNEMFRLEGWLGRHRILVIFFDADNTAAADPQLLAARAAYEALSRRDIKVVGVSTALPQQNRTAMEHVGEYPFPLVTDVDLTIHQRWGRLSVDNQRPLPGAFLIDRKGTVPAVASQPRPIENLMDTLKELTQ